MGSAEGPQRRLTYTESSTFSNGLQARLVDCANSGQGMLERAGCTRPCSRALLMAPSASGPANPQCETTPRASASLSQKSAASLLCHRDRHPTGWRQLGCRCRPARTSPAKGWQCPLVRRFEGATGRFSDSDVKSGWCRCTLTLFGTNLRILHSSRNLQASPRIAPKRPTCHRGGMQNGGKGMPSSSSAASPTPKAYP